MKTLKILKRFFKLKIKEFYEMKVHIWGLVFFINILGVCLIVYFKILINFLKIIVPFVWSGWILYGLFLFLKFLYRNWQKAKKEIENEYKI